MVPNYTGDCLNFGIAIEKIRQAGITVKFKKMFSFATCKQCYKYQYVKVIDIIENYNISIGSGGGGNRR